MRTAPCYTIKRAIHWKNQDTEPVDEHRAWHLGLDHGVRLSGLAKRPAGWPHKALAQELARFKKAEFIWCQEEPQNMGAWTFVQPGIERVLEFVKAKNTRPRYVGRAASASTATGLMSRHLKELKMFLDEALS